MFPTAQFGAANRVLSFFVSGEFNSCQRSFWEGLVDVKRLDTQSMVLINGNGLDDHLITLVNCYRIRAEFVIFGLNFKCLYFLSF